MKKNRLFIFGIIITWCLTGLLLRKIDINLMLVYGIDNNTSLIVWFLLMAFILGLGAIKKFEENQKEKKRILDLVEEEKIIKSMVENVIEKLEYKKEHKLKEDLEIITCYEVYNILKEIIPNIDLEIKFKFKTLEESKNER